MWRRTQEGMATPRQEVDRGNRSDSAENSLRRSDRSQRPGKRNGYFGMAGNQGARTFRPGGNRGRWRPVKAGGPSRSASDSPAHPVRRARLAVTTGGERQRQLLQESPPAMKVFDGGDESGNVSASGTQSGNVSALDLQSGNVSASDPKAETFPLSPTGDAPTRPARIAPPDESLEARARREWPKRDGNSPSQSFKEKCMPHHPFKIKDQVNQLTG